VFIEMGSSSRRVLSSMATIVSQTPRGLVPSAPRYKTPREDSNVVSVSNLAFEYRADEVSADRTYKGKTLVVSGVVQSISHEFPEAPYLTLTAAGSYMSPGVKAVFPGQVLIRL
jgi:putative nucleic acid binding protein